MSFVVSATVSDSPAESVLLAAPPKFLVWDTERGAFAQKQTLDGTFDFEVANKEGMLDVAMAMLADDTATIKQHMRLTGGIFVWPIVDHPPFRSAYGAFVEEMDRLNARALAHIEQDEGEWD